MVGDEGTLNLFAGDGGNPSAGVVESFKPTKRDPRRMSVRVAGKVVVTLPWEVIDELGIRVGTVWSAELEGRVLAAEAFDKAKRSALRSLERRAFSEGELVARLRKKGFAEAVALAVVGELAAVGYLDDEVYGRAVLRELTRTKPAGPLLMRRKLFEKRIERVLAERLIAEFLEGQAAGEGCPEAAEMVGGADELGKFVERKLAGMRNVDAATRSRRLFGLLARRGFDAATCREYVERYVSADADADAE